MRSLNINSINIAILDYDEKFVQIIKSVLEEVEDVKNIEIYKDQKSLLKAFETNKSNALMIDIFNVGVRKGTKLIETIREKYPYVPICLLAYHLQLEKFPYVSYSWRVRFQHYYRIPKDAGTEEIRSRAITFVEICKAIHMTKDAKKKLTKILGFISSSDHTKVNSSNEVGKSIENDVKYIKRAFDEREKSVSATGFTYPSYQSKNIETIITNTLSKACLELKNTVYIDIDNIIAGTTKSILKTLNKYFKY